MKSNEYKVPEKIFITLFSNDKMKKGSKELENWINSIIVKKNEQEALNLIQEKNKTDSLDANPEDKNKKNQETLKLILEQYKIDLFDANPEYKNNIIRGDLTPIFSMVEAIEKFEPDPKFYFILFMPLFNLYLSMEPKQIANFINKITNYLKKMKKIILSNFNELFEILIVLKINQEKDVKDSGNLLDQLLKESLQEYSDNMDLYQNIFDFDSVCKKINEKINLQQYIIISLLVNWIGTICKIRKTAVVKFFQDILPWIFRLQMGKAKDVSKNAENCLRTIKINLEENFTRYYKYDKKSMEEILSIIIKESSPRSDKISGPAWELLNLYMKKSEVHLDKYLKRENKFSSGDKNAMPLNINSNNSKNKDNEIKSSSTFKEIKAKSTMSLPENLDKNLLMLKDKNYNENDKKNIKRISKITAFKNLGGPSFEFKTLTDKQTFIDELSDDNQFSINDNILEYIPFKLFSKLFILITEAYSQDIEKLDLVNELNNTLKRIINKSPPEIKDYGFIVVDITNIILIGMKNPGNKNIKVFLNWCDILYKKYEKDIFKDFKIFIKEYTLAIPPNDSNIFMEMVKFLSNIKMEGDTTNIIIKNLTDKLMKDPELINNESYIIIILEHLTKNSSLEIVYESFSNVLKGINNYSFVSKMIHYLNQYLMRNPTAVKFRKALINNDNEEKYKILFEKMYNIWSIEPISLLIFCVITEHFELAYNIILNLVKVQLDNDYYMHLGSLVQLLESELYDYIRIRLLEPSNNIYLIRTLYGILMLLPQGQAFNVLSNRMSNVQTLFEIENGFNNIKEEGNSEEVNKYIEIFLNIQKVKREESQKNRSN